MSLSTFLTKKDVKEKFASTFTLPKITEINNKLLASPLDKRYTLVGTAFDYLFRFYLERINTKAISSTWVAEEVPQIVKEYKDLHKAATKIVCGAKLAYYDYLETGKIKNKLIEYALLLAQLDPILRAGEVDEHLGRVYYSDISELKKMISIVPKKLFKAKRICVLNPTFGEASALVNGADADLLLDDALIEIKTTMFYKVERRAFNQLIGYYILSLIGGIDNVEKKVTIKNIGIYFSRFGSLYCIPVKKFTMQRGFKSFVKWFERRAKKESYFFN